ncbi:hypothetical protein [Priestia megaterium]|uniref:hypothetical protein n=1 Tax=Priestia megaterium TaxID=1404 RepID=UPI00077D8D2E|nr:hypothetical protein [Priestia megaterium]
MAEKKGKIKIHGSLIYEIVLDQALETMKNESLEMFKERVKKVYFREALWTLPNVEKVAYDVFYDYYIPFIESAIKKSEKANGKIELDLIQGKSKTPNEKEYETIMEIQSQLEEHVRLVYSNYGASHLLKVKKILDELNLSSNFNLPIIEVW